MENIVIREACVDDMKKLSVLFKQVYIHTYGVDGISDEFANFIANQFSEVRIRDTIKLRNDCLLVAEFKNNLIGVLQIEFEKKCPVQNFVAPEINKLYILEWFSRKGVGKALMETAERKLFENGHKKIWLWTLASNLRAIGFYKQLGYKNIGKAYFQMEVNRYENLVLVKKIG